MKRREKLLLGLTLLVSCYATWETVRAARLDRKSAALRASNQQLQGKYRRLKDNFLQAAMSGTRNDQAFRLVLQVLEQDDGVDMITPSHPGNIRVNKPSPVSGHL